jgi:hypothetical protein
VFSGDLAAAVEPFQAALTSDPDLSRSWRQTAILLGSLPSLALVSGLLGDEETAVACHERVLAITTPRGESYFRAYSLWALGVIALRAGETGRAATLTGQALELIWQVNIQVMTGWCLESLAWIAIRGGNPTRAAVLMGAAETLTRTATDSSELVGDGGGEMRDELMRPHSPTPAAVEPGPPRSDRVPSQMRRQVRILRDQFLGVGAMSTATGEDPLGVAGREPTHHCRREP